MEAATAVDKLIYALKHGPSIIMDKPRELEVTWKERIASDLDAAYQSGKADMKKQMMMEAVEGQIVSRNDGWNSIELPSTFFGELSKNYKHGDKVRIIIVKEG
jgi:hypothetical protein